MVPNSNFEFRKPSAYNKFKKDGFPYKFTALYSYNKYLQSYVLYFGKMFTLFKIILHMKRQMSRIKNNVTSVTMKNGISIAFLFYHKSFYNK